MAEAPTEDEEELDPDLVVDMFGWKEKAGNCKKTQENARKNARICKRDEPIALIPKTNREVY